MEEWSGEERVDQGEFEDKEKGRESEDERDDQAQSEIEKECELIVESECEVQGEEIVQQENKCDELDKGYEVCMVCMLPDEKLMMKKERYGGGVHSMFQLDPC